MADKLKVALFLLLFVSFRPVITEEAIDQEGKYLRVFHNSVIFLKNIFLGRKVIFLSHSDSRTERDMCTSEQTTEDGNKN